MAGDPVKFLISPDQEEEQIVAELEQLGVNYLTRQAEMGVVEKRKPDELLAAMVRQPSSRVRTALIALLLAHPELARYIPAALKHLKPAEGRTMKFFYTAAVLLQSQHAEILKPVLGEKWQFLPDLFSDEFALGGDSYGTRIKSLAAVHAQHTGNQLNWAGTYESAASNLLRRWEIEGRCKR